MPVLNGQRDQSTGEAGYVPGHQTLRLQALTTRGRCEPVDAEFVGQCIPDAQLSVVEPTESDSKAGWVRRVDAGAVGVAAQPNVRSQCSRPRPGRSAPPAPARRATRESGRPGCRAAPVQGRGSRPAGHPPGRARSATGRRARRSAPRPPVRRRQRPSDARIVVSGVRSSCEALPTNRCCAINEASRRSEAGRRCRRAP